MSDASAAATPAAAATTRRAAFLDRDGVLNRNIFYADTGALESPRTSSEFHLFPGAIPSLRLLQAAGFALFLVSNQPNAAKGKSTMEELLAIQAGFRAHLEVAGVHFTDFFYCFHHESGTHSPWAGRCNCRKPSPFFLHRAASEHGISLVDSWMIGDRLSDVATGTRAGTRTILIASAPPESTAAEETPTAIAPGIAEAVAHILAASPLPRNRS